MSDHSTRRRVLLVTGSGMAALSSAGCLGSPENDESGETTEWGVEASVPVERVDQYNAPGCSCCEAYAEYLRENVTGTVSDTVAEDLTARKRDHGVPQSLQSCHTALVDGYVVEGHVPAAAISTLLDEAPAVDGIALPGMPAGSPGMGGQKQNRLTVRAFTDGSAGDVFATY